MYCGNSHCVCQTLRMPHVKHLISLHSTIESTLGFNTFLQCAGHGVVALVLTLVDLLSKSLGMLVLLLLSLASLLLSQLC
jgi:hypothetical protein